jgi:MFS family permease
MGFGTLIFFSSTTTLIQSYSEDSFRGRVMGIWTLTFGGVMPIGSLYAGALAQKIGIPDTLILSGVICIIFTAVMSILPSQKIYRFQEETMKFKCNLSVDYRSVTDCFCLISQAQGLQSYPYSM